MNKQPLSNYIYRDILNDVELKRQFEKLCSAYVNFLFNNKQIEFDDGFTILLKYADLLSLSEEEKHQNIAQQIGILMAQIFPERNEVQIYKECIYKNVSNFANLRLMKGERNLVEFEFLRNISFYAHLEKNRLNKQDDTFLFDTQKKLLKEIESYQFLSFSAPTSMGKTFIIINYIKNLVKNNKKENFAIIVPTRALLNEVANKIIVDFNEILHRFNYNVVTTTTTVINNKNFIAVLTPERLYYSLLKAPEIKFNQIFIDEAHKISEKDKRSIIYYKILDMIKNMTEEINIYFSSPIIPNPDVYLELTKFFMTGRSNGRVYLFSPVIQNKICIDFIEQKIKYLNALSNELVSCSNIDAAIENKYDALVMLGKNKCNLIYVSSASKAVEYANELYEIFNMEGKRKTIDSELEKTANFIETMIHKEYYLAKFIRQGIAYHIGALPAQIRIKIEKLIKCKLIKYCFCTSTLLEGVNVPADNLFILNHKKGLATLTTVDTLNLIGRAGRVTLNEFGNVFFLAEDVKYKKYVENVLRKPPPKQELLPQEAINQRQKKYIVERLLQGKTNLLDHGEKYADKKFSQATYEYATICLNMLLHDICNKNESYILRAFTKNHLTPQNIVDIRKKFETIVTKNDDVNISAIQKKSLYKRISDSNIGYPENMEYNDCLAFLKELSEIFQWEIYERETLGKGRKLHYYAVILLSWINGKGIHEIVRQTIDYYNRNNLIIMMYDNMGKNQVEYDGSQKHKNIVINDMLNDIEQIVNFKFSMYFLRFSEAIIKIRNIKSISNDWYEYIEYGTNNKIVIKLQKHGLTREFALQIKNKYSNYIEYDNEDIFLSEEILKIKDDDLKEALTTVAMNFPELYTKNIVNRDGNTKSLLK